jgi:hypothetical protein
MKHLVLDRPRPGPAQAEENPMRFGAGIWLFGQFVDRYATDAYGSAVSTIEAIQRPARWTTPSGPQQLDPLDKKLEAFGWHVRAVDERPPRRLQVHAPGVFAPTGSSDALMRRFDLTPEGIADARP